jgi:hypothetical protein
MSPAARKTHPQPPPTRLEAEREQRRIAADCRSTLGLLEAAAAVPPDLLDLLKTMQGQIADLQARVIGVEGRQGYSDDTRIDGEPRPAGKWLRMKAAVGETGYSESGLRRLCRLGRCVADYSGPHLLVNVDSIPRRSVKVLKV